MQDSVFLLVVSRDCLFCFSQDCLLEIRLKSTETRLTLCILKPPMRTRHVADEFMHEWKTPQRRPTSVGLRGGLEFLDELRVLLHFARVLLHLRAQQLDLIISVLHRLRDIHKHNTNHTRELPPRSGVRIKGRRRRKDVKDGWTYSTELIYDLSTAAMAAEGKQLHEIQWRESRKHDKTDSSMWIPQTKVHSLSLW